MEIEPEHVLNTFSADFHCSQAIVTQSVGPPYDFLFNRKLHIHVVKCTEVVSRAEKGCKKMIKTEGEQSREEEN